jgi:DEAD/DEAH box helicase domain-containing protein
VFNDDKKLIAFSDSVQDAAHRAGFFGARTWLNNVRTAWAHVMDELGLKAHALVRSSRKDGAQRSTTRLGAAHVAGALVSEFLAPNMTWQHDWSVELLEKGICPLTAAAGQGEEAPAVAAVQRPDLPEPARPNLERIGKVTLSVPWAWWRRWLRLLPRSAKQFGAHGLELKPVTQWLWGMLAHMRQPRWGDAPGAGAYAATASVCPGPKPAGRAEWMPKMGEYTPRPVLLTLGKQPAISTSCRQVSAPPGTTAGRAVLGQQMLLAKGMAADMYREALRLFKEARHSGAYQPPPGRHAGHEPEALELDTEVAFVATAGSKRRLAVPRQDAEHLLGMPCLDAPGVRYEPSSRRRMIGGPDV